MLQQLPDPTASWQLERTQLLQFGSGVDEHCWYSENGCCFLYTDLRWDSAFFKRPMAKLRAILFDSARNLRAACRSFTRHLASLGIQHCITEIPAEDTQVLQALGHSEWLLVETRLQYVHEHLAALPPERYAVRSAIPQEQTLLSSIAAENANPFDRFHADPFFSKVEADAFLGAYAAAAVNGYCDDVLVPDEIGIPLDSFITVNYQQVHTATLGLKIGRPVVMAVGPQNRGWSRKLLAEALHRAHEHGVEAIVSTTQATNKAIIRNKEKLGFRLAAVTHILSWSGR
ncbi:hypothetical protein [Hymenobacter wooponensis]|uniref:Uncharacterized protein n=1 Tax=Hymenobacter wooponensis TaxID=1525360 RepID=A0A4Z0MT57_9BACT|nr:hypothetical protein [Hymenobacter wooponensis]TGD83003.1 hypothetical protein EU557_04280 [Hymenobacter wooponensis]